MAYVSDLFIAVERHNPMKAVDQAVAVTDKGFEGCIHGRTGSKRQLLLVDAATLAEFRLEPGIMRENITIVGLNVADLRMGQRLAIGGAVLEVTIPCEPCFRMDEIRTGLREALGNRRGVLCRVVQGGRISRGDRIQICEAVMVIPSAGGAR
jgi:MOSC domain-containing protein YiiM